jgi:type IV secretory pathway TrbD component
MKRRVVNAIGLALIIAAAFGIGMWFMYFIMWTDVFTKFIEMADKVFVS